jgi:hypothetical protein
MGRDGFATRDRSTTTYHDAKVVRAVARAGLAAAVAWDALVDASWSSGSRVKLEEALLGLPRAFALGDELELARVLEEEGLLDSEHRVPVSSWEGWYVPAAGRRAAARAGGLEGARRRWGSPPDRVPIREPIRGANALRPPTSPRKGGGGRRGGGVEEGTRATVRVDGPPAPAGEVLRPFRDAMTAAGFAGFTMEGGNDGTTG